MKFFVDKFEKKIRLTVGNIQYEILHQRRTSTLVRMEIEFREANITKQSFVMRKKILALSRFETLTRLCKTKRKPLVAFF